MSQNKALVRLLMLPDNASCLKIKLQASSYPHGDMKNVEHTVVKSI